MHGSAERRAGWSQSEVFLHNQTNGLRSVNQLARGAPWSVYALRTSTYRLSTDLIIWWVRSCHSVFFLDHILLLLLFWIWFSKYNLLLLFWIWFSFRIPCLSVFSVGGHIRVWILLYFYIILFSRLIWDPGMSEGLSLLAPDWYRESRELSFGPWLVQRVSHLYYILFYHFTGSYLYLTI
jgi:hypothetical protein